MSKIIVFLQMIKFEHTIFALPFAYLGMLLAADGSPTGGQVFFITLAMIGARTAAMSLNRLIDRRIDQKNPRTAGRAIPAGLLAAREVWLYVFLSFTLLVFAAARLSPLAVKLLPLAVFVLSFYSYTKRFTWLCHLVLGAALGLAPMGAWVAVTNHLPLPAYLLGAAVALWVAGFDLIYACQDFEFDRQNGVYSIPARFGIQRALTVSSLMHGAAILLLVILGFSLDLGLPYAVGVLISAGLLFYEHRLVTAADLSRLDTAFLNMNGYLSLVMFMATWLSFSLAG